jgi:hypothetical protein
MGRPIKKKFFGNLNTPDHGSVTQGSGVGGEGVASVSVSNTGTGYSQGATVSFTAPDVAGGTVATGHATLVANGVSTFGVTGIVVDNAGTGYLSAPTVTVVPATTVNTTANATNGQFTLTNVASVAGIYLGMKIDGSPGVQATCYVTAVGTNTITLSKTMTASTTTNSYAFSDQGSGFADTVTLTSGIQNAIAFSSYIPTGSTARTNGDIIKQEASHRYLVQNSDGVGQCKLVSTSTLAAGQMNIIATDWNGSTYFVTKLTAHRARLNQYTVNGSFLIADGATTGWTLNGATGTVVTIAHTI